MKKGTQTLFTESLKYNSPSSSSGGNALYTGLISERSDQWKFTNFGQGVTTTDGYQYDNAGRLTYVKRGSTVGTLSYDARGNVLTAEGDSYTYSGDRVATFTPSGQSAVYFTHDSRGRMTYDGMGGVTIDYNYLNLPRKISGTGGTLAKYSYLANGSKTGAENGSGAGLVYRGSLIYKKASNGTLTFDGASIPEGRLLSGATRLYVTDHLGSVKAVVNGNNGNLYEVNNYTVYGKQSANSSASSYLSTAPTGEKFRQHFTGKEDQAPDFTVPFTDFGARQYSPALRRWLVPDPLSEKYYGISPYAYCAGDPVNLLDPDGKGASGIVKALKAAKKAYKMNKRAQKITAGALLASEIYGYYDDANTLLSPESSWAEKGFAVFDLVTGFGSEAKSVARHLGFNSLLEVNYRAFTYRNFRHNLWKLSGEMPEGMDAHHTIPQTFRKRLSEMNVDINIDDPKYGVWLDMHLHRKTKDAYNKEWMAFFEEMKNRRKNLTAKDIEEEAKYLMYEFYGITLSFE